MVIRVTKHHMDGIVKIAPRKRVPSHVHVFASSPIIAARSPTWEHSHIDDIHVNTFRADQREEPPH